MHLDGQFPGALLEPVRLRDTRASQVKSEPGRSCQRSECISAFSAGTGAKLMTTLVHELRRRQARVE